MLDLTRYAFRDARLLATAVLAIWFVGVAAVLVLALARPWTGMTLTGDGEGARVVSVEPASPAARAGVEPGWRLTGIAGGAAAPVEARDLEADPDGLNDPRAVAEFFRRNARIAAILGGAAPVFGFVDGAGARREIVIAPRHASLRSLGALFWTQLAAGLAGALIGSWVLAARPGAAAAAMFFLSTSYATVAIWMSALYTTRELAMDPTLFRVASAANGFAVVGFAGAFCALVAVYPRRVVGRKGLAAFLLAPVAAMAAEAAGLTPDLRWTRLGPVVTLLTLALALIVAQWRWSARRPLDRAAMRWFLIALGLGFGFFLAASAAPILRGSPALLEQGYVMAAGAPFFAALAVAVARYRLFALEPWSFAIAYYFLGAVLLLTVDLALVAALGLARDAAYALSLLGVGFLYLPARNRLWGWWAKPSRLLRPDRLYAEATALALEPAPDRRRERWRDFLRDAFAPAAMTESDETPAVPLVRESGLALLMPACAGSPALLLRERSRSRALFRPEDAELMRRMVVLVGDVEQSRESYARGAREERARIAQDLHDDVGARLLTALHAGDERTRPVITELLADIRAITGGLTGEATPLLRVLAECRLEAATRLDRHGLALDWPATPDGFPDPSVDYARYKAIASSLRECVTNIVKHATGAARVTVDMRFVDGVLRLRVSDDGAGGGAPDANGGSGWRNIRRRMAKIGGEAAFASTPTGTSVLLAVPFETATPAPPRRREGSAP